jgi:hypothetical protein
MTMNQKFENMLDLEAAIRGERVSAGFGMTPDQRHKATQRMKKLRAELYRNLDNLTDREMKEFSEYRKTAH